LKNMSLLYNDICPQMKDTFLGRLMSQGGGQDKFWGDSLQYSTV